ncbi:hypothetical protein BDW59DRAFT_106667 [Aspergillus cavernicola]|uniref:Secreted protein n=1 Tax=Aspergillus cavernicola TaxID=176166 RepID=A0ABR4I324_9EURO
MLQAYLFGFSYTASVCCAVNDTRYFPPSTPTTQVNPREPQDIHPGCPPISTGIWLVVTKRQKKCVIGQVGKQT